ncbi:MAG: NUDIX domain-containing protein [Bacteroidales bacterium]|nr:NUDIX domain-containing protein [Bacteroidales bacterium]
MKIKKFNIRVYGILINTENQVLLTDEYRLGIKMTKFPGGGLKFGEGTIDCLKREFREELGCDIKIVKHLYTTDFFQPTQLLKETQQLISIYYLVEIVGHNNINTTDKKFDFDDLHDGAQCFRWFSINELNPDELTFPIDKKVANILRGLSLKEKY